MTAEYWITGGAYAIMLLIISVLILPTKRRTQSNQSELGKQGKEVAVLKSMAVDNQDAHREIKSMISKLFDKVDGINEYLRNGKK